MAGKETRWSAGTLKSRGWTDGLMDLLLPKPQYRYFNGRRARTWHPADVRKAELTEEFRTGHIRRESAPTGNGIPGEDAIPVAAAFLSEAWLQAEQTDSREYRLAERYHSALLRQLPGAVWAERLKPGQCQSYVEHFLHLADERQVEPHSGIFKRFITAAVWMGRNTDAPKMETLKENYASMLLAVAERELALFTAAQPEANVDGLLDMPKFPYAELLNHPLSYLYSVFYIPQAIRSSLKLLVALNPKDEYPEARAMKRKFILHIGGTNTGKTYAGFQRLKKAKTGVYLAPLRLLALEAQEILLDAGVDCALTTGEEEDRRDTDTHVAATAEKLELDKQYEVAVIDECQMIADRERGFAWTRAILGVQAPEVHLCSAPEAKDLLIRIIDSCGDDWEVVQHLRKTPLVCMNHPVDYKDFQPGDALITFSKVGVLSIAEDLRHQGKEPAIIYGALPYATRRKQMEGFLRGDMEYVVSTDAIGMGLNLPIRRVIFMDTQKFDGVERRDLKPAEIQQIAGRAGRYGMYDKGYVGSTENLDFIAAGLETVVPPLHKAVAGFSELVLHVDFDLLEVLTEWNKMPTVAPYEKLDVSRYISLITKIRDRGFRLTKEQELRCANIPFDETDEELLRLFFAFLWMAKEGEPLERPALEEKRTWQYTLPELEQYCRKLDLYFSFSKAFSCPVDREALAEERERVAESINQILLHNLRNNIRFCPRCGAALPLHTSGRLCSSCYRKQAGPAFRTGGFKKRRR